MWFLKPVARTKLHRKTQQHGVEHVDQNEDHQVSFGHHSKTQRGKTCNAKRIYFFLFHFHLTKLDDCKSMHARDIFYSEELSVHEVLTLLIRAVTSERAKHREQCLQNQVANSEKRNERGNKSRHKSEPSTLSKKRLCESISVRTAPNSKQLAETHKGSQPKQPKASAERAERQGKAEPKASEGQSKGKPKGKPKAEPKASHLYAEITATF